MSSGATLTVFTGFLGSGKTTVLHDLLTQIRSERVGVIVNEWGNLGVDSALLRTSGVEQIRELLGGQIFCSCLSGSFLSTIESLLNLNVTTLLVETSGLAKPSTIRELVEEGARRLGGRLRYQGMVCVIDAERFLKFRSVVNVLNEQVVYSDYFIITKADRTDPETLQRTMHVLQGYKPDAKILVRAGKPIPVPSFLQEGTQEGVIPNPYDPRWAGWGQQGRPGTMTIPLHGSVSREGLNCFLSRIASQTFRIKGVVSVQDEMHPILIEGVEGTVEFLPLEAEEAFRPIGETGITLIWKSPTPSKEQVLQTWIECTGRGDKTIRSS
ncbi:MAG: GTP-binding protein [Spirochaetes bacterium]|nr:GTP-binding protein [Spirochaetota bacterium]